LCVILTVNNTFFFATIDKVFYHAASVLMTCLQLILPDVILTSSDNSPPALSVYSLIHTGGGGKQQCCVEVSNRFAALEDLDINRVGKLLERISKFQPKRV
jgi:hypothetical protein